jgi:hypothetical protein
MARWRLIACVVITVLAVRRGEGQTGSPALTQELAGIRATHELLAEVIETRDLQEEMPFAKFLDELARRVVKTGKITFRIDQEAFGGSFGAVKHATVQLPAVPRRMSLGTALRIAVGQQKVACVYRVDPAYVTITTPGRSIGTLHTADYDIRDLVEKSPDRDRAAPALRIVQRLIAACDRLSSEGGTDPVIQIRNGHQLAIRASALGHLDVIDVLAALRRAADVAVIVQAQLYEVDDAFYTRLRKVKRISLEELERRFLDGKAPKGELLKLLANEKPVQVGDKAKVSNGATVALLSRYAIVTGLPTPWSARTKENAKQIIREGVSFTGSLDVSTDRRSVRLHFTEKAATIEARELVKVVPIGFHHHFENNEPAPPKEIDAERVFVKESATTRVLEIPDGGTLLVAVQYRPQALAANQRWWVLSITPRIWIEEEERMIRERQIPPIP